MTQLAPEVRAALETAVIDGTRLTIPTRLAPRVYKAVNQVLQRLGGNWDKRTQAHLFAADPSAALAALLAGGETPPDPRKLDGFFATPDALADEIVRDYAGIVTLPAGARVLEPSAGDGSLVRAILRANPAVEVVAVEPNHERAERCDDGSGRVLVETETLETIAARRLALDVEPFAAVVMNPPFALPGQPAAWIDHIELAWKLLRPGGRLVGIAPASLGYRQDRRHTGIRAWVTDHGRWVALPERAFAAAGTGVHTVVLWADKPALDAARAA